MPKGQHINKICAECGRS